MRPAQAAADIDLSRAVVRAVAVLRTMNVFLRKAAPSAQLLLAPVNQGSTVTTSLLAETPLRRVARASGMRSSPVPITWGGGAGR